MVMAHTNRVATFDAIGTASQPGDNSLAALRRANLDFDVELKPVLNPVTGNVIMEDGEPKYFATIRTDTKEALGIVEGRYHVIHNRDVFDIADAMVNEDGAQITRASCLDHGARCFMNLSWPKSKSINVVGDIVGRRALLQNAHNGKFSTLIRLMPLRLACINGMLVPIPGFTFEFRIKHTQSAEGRLAEARRIMAGASSYFDAFGRVAERMARTRVTTNQAEKILNSITELSKTTDAAQKKRTEIMDLFNGSQSNGHHEAVKNTAWGLFNAIGEHADHSGRIRLTRDNSPEVQRFKSGFEGSAQRLKLSAYEAMLKNEDLGLREFMHSLN